MNVKSMTHPQAAAFKRLVRAIAAEMVWEIVKDIDKEHGALVHAHMNAAMMRYLERQEA